MSDIIHRSCRNQERPLPVAAALVVFALNVAACGNSAGSSGASTAGKVSLSGSITVSAAASLKSAFTQMGKTFESEHHGTTVAFNFGSSGALATQIQQGAPADVFASASSQDMDPVVKAGDISGTPAIFAHNSLEIVVRPGNPLGIHSLADLTKASVVSICASSAPCGATAEQALMKAHVSIPTSSITLGQDVDTTLAAVTTGDAEAAIVYVTNARSVGTQGVGVPIPTSLNVSTSYPIAVITSAKDKALAEAWVAYVLAPAGQKVLHQAGFLPA